MTLRATVSTIRAHHETGGRRRWMRLIVHDTVDEFRAAAHHYRPEYGADWWAPSVACFHPAPVRIRIGPDDSEQLIDHGFLGVLRLTAGHLGSEVVAHECTHAALAAYRMDVTTFVHLGNGCGHREETLAYLVGDLVRGTSNALHRLGAWS